MDVFKKHQLAIARRTLRMPDALLNMIGGMTKEEARKILEKEKGKPKTRKPKTEK